MGAWLTKGDVVKPWTFQDQKAFDQSLSVGQRIMAHWTHSYHPYHVSAVITKINAKSILASIEEEIRSWRGDLLFRKGDVIKVPRVTNLKRWTGYNCISPL